MSLLSGALWYLLCVEVAVVVALLSKPLRRALVHHPGWSAAAEGLKPLQLLGGALIMVAALSSECTSYNAGFAALLCFVTAGLYECIDELQKLTSGRVVEGRVVEGDTDTWAAAAHDGTRDALEARAAELEARVATLEVGKQELSQERDRAMKSAEAIKKQAEGVSTEYARLVREKESLENKLADFELLMGEENKKKK
jgi:hypothetical protein